MLFLLPLVGAAILGVAAAASIKRVDPVYRAVVVRFGKRREDLVYGEGWHGFWDGILPFIDRFEVKPITLDPLAISTKVVTRDNMQVAIGGSVQYRVDDVYRNLEINPATMGVGMSDAIKSELGIIAGRVDGDQFVGARREISLLVNSMLRFSNPPHYRASAADPTVFDPAGGDQEVPPEDRLSFYRKNVMTVWRELNDETNHSDDRSVVEERYGIDVVVFELGDVAFTPETVAALEKKRQAELVADAAQSAFKRQMNIFRKLKKEVGPERALNEASLVIGGKDRGSRQIFSIEGLEGVADALRELVKGRNNS